MTRESGVPSALESRLLWAAICASFVSFLDGSIVNVALPAIARDVGGGIVTQQWVVDGYLLTLSALILVSGAVSDAFGRLRVLRIAIVAFAITSAACAIAPTASLLIAARLLQGVAGALLVPGSLGLIIATFEGAAQSKAIGRWTGWTSVASLVGPVVGGTIVDLLGWRVVFVLGVVPAAAALLLLGRARDVQADGAPKVDWSGAALAAIGLAGITVVLIEAPRLGISSPVVLIALALGVVGLVAFWIQNRRSRDLLVPLRLFRGNFASGNLATLFIYGGLGVSFLVVTLYLQEVVRLPATVAAVCTLPATIVLILLSGRFGALAGTYGPRRFMAGGPVVGAIGFAFIALTPDPAHALVFVIPGVVILGLGLAITVAPLTAAVLQAVPEAESGIGSAINNAVARVAGLVTTALIGVIVGGAMSQGGFVRGVLVVVGLLVVGGVVSFLGITDPKRDPTPAG